MTFAAVAPIKGGGDATAASFVAAVVLVFTLTSAVKLLTSRAGEGQRAPNPPRRDRTATVSGLLAIVSAALMAAGVNQQPIVASTPGFWESLRWYILAWPRSPSWRRRARSCHAPGP
jgi:hypothetical protein